jgi:hypothetical protein
LSGTAGSVDTSWILGSARVVIYACSLASRVTVAILNAFLVVFRADEVRKCLGILGGVWRKPVATNALEVKGCLSGFSFYSREFNKRVLTGSQVLAAVVEDEPASWRQSNGQDDCWDWHHDSKNELSVYAQRHLKNWGKHTTSR